jgi:archaetidylinositol phosphate synthase
MNKRKMEEIEKHQRINDILLGPLERPALQWLSAHMPAWMNPDILTGIGIFGAVVIFISYWLTNTNPNFLWLASLGFVINWFGDSLDGTLARYRHIERPKYGFFVDHTVDAISEVMIFTGVGLSPYMRLDIALLALVGYLLMSIMVYVRTCVEGVFKISYGKIGPTEMRVFIILGNTLIYFIGIPMIKLPFLTISLWNALGAFLAAALLLVFIYSTINDAKQLDEVDRKKKEKKTSDTL